MFRNISKTALLFTIFLSAMLIHCSSSGYQNWYADEGQEEDLLGGVFSNDDYSEDAREQPVTSGQWDNWYDDGSQTTIQNDDTSSLSTTPLQKLSPQSRSLEANASAQYTLEFKITVIKEIKLAEKNQIKLILKSSVRIPEMKDMQWKMLKNSILGQIDGDVILQNVEQSTLRNDGLIELLLSPAKSGDYFSFVPLADAGINAPGFAAPFNALELKSININVNAATNHSYSYQYNFQTYNIKVVASAFAEKVITPLINNVQVNILDSETHYPISGATVTLTGTPPSAMKILSSYISDTQVLLHAVKAAPRYVSSKSKSVSGNQATVISCYCPTAYYLHIMHPQYFYLDKKVEVNKETDSLTYYLTRRPENVRILEKNKK
jgi:hypothetical protein